MKRIFVDLEHTGSSTPHILDLAVVNESGQVLFDKRFKPPAEVFRDKALLQHWHITASMSHGIKPKDVSYCPSLESHMEELGRIFDGAVMVAHNTSCELRVLPAPLTQILAGSICTMKLFRRVEPGQKASLGAALDFCSHTLENAHTALADAQGCRQLLGWIEDRHPQQVLDLQRDGMRARKSPVCA